MSTLMLQLNGDMTFNRTIFPPYLYVYDDLLIYKRRKWFVVKEITVSYHHIHQIILSKGIFFATIVIETASGADIILKFVNKKLAIQAKKIIDQKIYHSHAKHTPNKSNDHNSIKTYEKSLNRLKELEKRGDITEKEFQKKKDEMLRTIR